MIKKSIVLFVAMVVFTVFGVGSALAVGTNNFRHKPIVINEVMWMGSDKSTSDEWIELRNMGGQDINLKDYVIENAGSGRTPDVKIEGNKVIPAWGYFLISNYSEGSEKSALNVPVDLVVLTLSLNNDGEQLTLKDPEGKIIDQTPEGGWPAGLNDPSNNNRRSMERKRYPREGTDSANWKTCNAKYCHFISFWDALKINWGTPKGANL